MSTLRFVILASLFSLACGGADEDDDGPATIGSQSATDPTTDTGSASDTATALAGASDGGSGYTAAADAPAPADPGLEPNG